MPNVSYSTRSFELTPRLILNCAAYTSYLGNQTINGQIAQAVNGATIVLEHRFFGESNPYDDLSETSFRVHTVQQAINDLVYFAQNVALPMPNGSNLAPGKAPWILVGGSYAGALTSYTMTRLVRRISSGAISSFLSSASLASSMQASHLRRS